MKKVLLATTILGMTAGFAAAEIAFSGTAKAGFAQSTSQGTDTEPYSFFELNVDATGESDSGLSFGASTSFSSGIDYDTAGDFDEDNSFSFKSVPVEDVDPSIDGMTIGGGMGKPKIFISGDFGKITAKHNGFKEYQDDNAENYDLEYTHTIAGLSVGVRTGLDSGDVATGLSSVSLGYTVAGVALSAKYDELGEKWGVSAAYTMNALTFTLATNDEETSSLKVAYSANGISGSIKADNKETWDLEAGYSANGITVGASTNEAEEWKVTGSYDLGAGLTAEAGFNAAEDMYLGAKMKF